MVTWVKALKKTRNSIQNRLRGLLDKNEPLDEWSMEEMEETLLQADIPFTLVEEILATQEKAYKGLNVSRKKMLAESLKKELGDFAEYTWKKNDSPRCVVILGVNGSGKTTTSAKLAAMVKHRGLTPVLGATDTFRAAGSQQLKLWADRIGCHCVTGQQGADAAAVAYDALDSAIARNADVLFIDTAGRMHTKQPLMEELKKIDRALKKRIPDAPHEVWMVLDASIGQNAIIQAKQFNECMPLTGTVIAKLDGSSKAGFIFSIQKQLAIPVVYAGLGEGVEDLVPFDPSSFVGGLLGLEEEKAE